MGTKQQTPAVDETTNFTPKFGPDGLIPCVTVSKSTDKVLMMAFMNAEALEKTLKTGEAHYWSRSRNKLWKKGETSSQTQKVIEMRVDCDQDCLLLTVEMPPPDKACHTGHETCFYRVIDGKKLIFKD